MEVLTAEPLQETQQKPPIHRFSKENAAELGRKGAIAKKQSDLARKTAEVKALADAELARPLLEQAVAQAVAATGKPDEEYRQFRLTRTREQLLALDRQLEAETDPKALKSLADAIARLCDVEQRLAMRPNPGSYRPSKPRTEQSSSDATPL